VPTPNHQQTQGFRRSLQGSHTQTKPQRDALQHAPIPNLSFADENNGLVAEDGVVSIGGTGDPAAFADAFAQTLAAHRHHDRDVAAVPV